jgi:hypothetical protein
VRRTTSLGRLTKAAERLLTSLAAGAVICQTGALGSQERDRAPAMHRKEGRMISKHLKRSGVLMTLVAVGALAGTAAMALVMGTGSPDKRVDVRSETVAFGTTSPVFVDLPGANFNVIVPSASYLLIARFAGESRCSGAAEAAAAAYCSLQIIATNTATGASVAFDPAAGIDYAFDTNPAGAADDGWESNAMERSKRLPAGAYRIKVQWAVTKSTTAFRLDDWHFSVETRGF